MYKRQLFYTWVSYEALDVKQLSHSDSEFYAAGLGVCSWIVNGQATATRSVDVLKQNAGYTGTEAAAIVRSALVALCPSYDLGFRTAFDTDFAKFVDSMRGRITFLRDIAYEEVGTFMAATCMILGDPSIGGAGVYGACLLYTSQCVLETALLVWLIAHVTYVAKSCPLLI